MFLLYFCIAMLIVVILAMKCNMEEGRIYYSIAESHNTSSFEIYDSPLYLQAHDVISNYQITAFCSIVCLFPPLLSLILYYRVLLMVPTRTEHIPFIRLFHRFNSIRQILPTTTMLTFLYTVRYV